MKIGTILAVLLPVRSVPVSRDVWFIWTDAGAIMSATFLSRRAEIESDSVALCILSSGCSLWMALQDMLISGIDGVELCPVCMLI